MENKHFKMIDEEFTCLVCGFLVKPLGYTARDHCPNCLCSLHLDNYPGDRKCMCHGVLNPIGIEKGKKDTLKIIYECETCKMIKKNKMANYDNMDKIIYLMSHPK